MGIIPEAPLGSKNATIPVIGFGTASWPLGGSETLKQSILHAIKLGYRHFDTAAVYQSEHCLGEAIAQALQLRLIKSREELFITSKLWCSDAHPNRVLPALQNTLRRLGLEYINLYLIHWPVTLKSEGYDVPFSQKDLVPIDFKSVWEAMEECHRLGLSRNIGVSNFSCKKLEQLLLTSKIPPAVNQVEISPLWQQAKLREFCHKKGIHITAFSPLGARGTVWGNNQVLDCEVLREIAEAKGKTVAQVCLRWAYEQGVSLVVKSFNEGRMKENICIFDWKLSPEECLKIEQIPQQRACLGHEFISEDSPYKSFEELWDGNSNKPICGTNQVLDCEVLREIAEAKGKTVAQVCLRWIYEQGVSLVVKSFNEERMKENISVFDWKLSPEECLKIERIPQQRICPGQDYISEDGPYKSVEELWDGEI